MLEQYRGTPIESLLFAQNLGRDLEPPGVPNLIIATCIDPRIELRVPTGSAFVIRTAGVNLKDEAVFMFAYLSAVVGLRHVALIAHDDCAMVGLRARRGEFVAGQAQRPGRNELAAGLLFDRHADAWEVGDTITVVREHAREIRHHCGADIVIAPLFYAVSDGRLHQIEETGGPTTAPPDLAG